MTDSDNLEPVRVLFADGGELVEPPADFDDPEDPQASPPAADDGAGKAIEAPKPARPGELPRGCPITPLGVQGSSYFFLDASQQLREIQAKSLVQSEIRSLLGRHTYLASAYWPRHSKEGEINGVKWDKASDALVAACHIAGIQKPEEYLRGRGAWIGEDFELVLHLGNRIARVDGAELDYTDPGKHGSHVYPGDTASPGPAPSPEPGGDQGAAAELRDLFNTWAWARGDLAAQLMVGWVGCAMIGGALNWRPLAWITGDRGTGKSTLLDVIGYIMGNAMIKASDASAAGIWQKAGYASLPVMLDEIEAEEDNRKIQNVVKLARQAASGGLVLRGGSDHSGASFTARSCFLFSSVLIPPLLPQDVSRIAILELNELGDRVAPKIDPRALGEMGSRIQRRLMDVWPRMSETLETWRSELRARKFDGRGCDVFGTLFAVADLMLHDTPISGDELDAWCDRLVGAGYGSRSRDMTDAGRCIDQLLTSALVTGRGANARPISAWVADAAGRFGASDGEAQEANGVLQTIGIKVARRVDGSRWLSIAKRHQGLAGVYKDTQWQGRGGSDGGWTQSLGRLEGAEPAPSNIKMAGLAMRCLQIPIDVVLGPDDGATHPGDDPDP